MGEGKGRGRELRENGRVWRCTKQIAPKCNIFGILGRPLGDTPVSYIFKIEIGCVVTSLVGWLSRACTVAKRCRPRPIVAMEH